MIYAFNALEVFKIALEIEDNGKRFYETVQAKTDDDGVKAVFAELAEEEVKHKERFKELMADLPESTTGSTVWDPQGELDQYLKMMADLHVFRSSEGVDQAVAGVEDARDALRLGIQFEKDSIVFFAEMQANAEDRTNREKIGLLVAEEQSHLRRLANELKRRL